MGQNGSKKGKRGRGETGSNNNLNEDDETAVFRSIEDGREYKLVVLGEGGVGKTAVTIQFMNNKFVDSYDPTIEDAYRKEYTIDDEGTEKNIVVEIIDTAGQEEFSSGLHDKFIRQGEGFLCVYSITASSSFEKLKEVREKILWVKDTNTVAMVLIGNKKDLEKDRTVNTDQGEALAEQYECPFFETSAKTTENITESVESLLWEVAKLGIQSDSGVMSRPM
eukprot:TRINITY_DN89534_c0_g1_i1.p1 TRINITY_DN89534_c0_g1~~TRINITY_DN89534_c0_g1_i1.p1  ORF type:complete len:222 (+),score=58.99 TRINITY_DN89534_c0_g1_i1:186-851(+)